MVTILTQLGYVNNYDKNSYLEFFSKAAVYICSLVCVRTLQKQYTSTKQLYAKQTNFVYRFFFWNL